MIFEAKEENVPHKVLKIQIHFELFTYYWVFLKRYKGQTIELTDLASA